jgi:flavin-dependent dehydrogenase
VQCAEALSRCALEENGLEPKSKWIKQQVKGARPQMPNGSFFYVTQRGYSIIRSNFDSWLMKGAVDAGAELKVRCRAKKVMRKGSHWRVHTDSGEFEGTILIGADGPSSNTAQWLGMVESRQFARALEYTFREQDFEFPEKEWLTFIMGAAWSGGSAWVFPRGDEWNVGVGGFGRAPESLDRLLKHLGIDASKRTRRIAGLVPYRFKLSNLAGVGVMIAGDAAGTTNPIIGSGIRPALNSGRIAGETACQALDSENSELTMQYDERMRMEPFLDPVLHRSADYLRSWTDEDWNFLGEMMKGRDESELTVLEGTVTALKKPRYLLRGREFMTIRKGIGITNKYGW